MYMYMLYAYSYPTYTLSIESTQIGTYFGFSQDGRRANPEHGETSTTGTEGRGAHVQS